jgi:hypothetical protein
MQIISKLLFWLAVVFALVMASLKHPPALPGDPNDKLQHITAFVVLSLLACWAYPRLSSFAVLVGLGLFGGLIELIQAIPLIHRDPDVRDWLADGAAIAATLLVIAAIRWLRPRPRAG